MKRGESAELGRMGEQLLRRTLQQKGVEIIASNWRCAYGEIDLIVGTEEEIVFIEVKTRRSPRFAEARESVNRHKQQCILQSAQCWLLEHPAEERQPRFDVAEIYAPQGVHTLRPTLHYLTAAFDAEDAN